MHVRDSFSLETGLYSGIIFELTEQEELTGEEEENQHHNKSVAKVEEGGRCSSDRQLGNKEMNRVQEEIHRSTATGQERSPPPVIILQLNKTYRMRGWVNTQDKR